MLSQRPIYNELLKRVAYEILLPKDILLNQEIVDTFLSVINISDKKLPLFIPIRLKSLIEELPEPIENQIVFLIDAEEINSKYSLDEFSQLNESSNSLAVVFNNLEQLSFLNVADYICLTEEFINQAGITRLVRYSKEKQRKLMGYSLEAPESYEKCRSLDFDFYCGNFLYKPVDIRDEEIAGNKLNLLVLIQKIHHNSCDIQAISKIIKSDPLLSYQLLRVANAATYFSYPIESIEQAIARIGLINLKKWVMIFSMKNISDKPIEILESSLVRAYMCQELIRELDESKMQLAYTVGLLSVIDSLLNKPMNQVLEKINLVTEITDALLFRTGPFGAILALVIAYEAGDWEHVPKRVFNNVHLNEIYLEALRNREVLE
jgi:c-di-GMP-related signal transduction protein